MSDNPRIKWFKSVKNMFDKNNVNFIEIGNQEGVIYNSNGNLIQDMWVDNFYNDLNVFFEKTNFFEISNFFTFFNNIFKYEENKHINEMKKLHSSYVSFIYSKDYVIIFKIIKNSSKEKNFFKIDFLVKKNKSKDYIREYTSFNDHELNMFLLSLKNYFENIFEIKESKSEEDVAFWIKTNKDFFLKNNIKSIYDSESFSFHTKENKITKIKTFNFDNYQTIKNIAISSEFNFKNIFSFSEETYIYKEEEEELDLLQTNLSFVLQNDNIKILISLDRFLVENNIINITKTPSENHFFFNYFISINNAICEYENLDETNKKLIDILLDEFKYIYFDYFK